MGTFLKNGSYYIDYYAHGKRYREKIGPSEALAKIVLAKRKVEIAEGKFLDKKDKVKIKFEIFADEYYNLHAKINNKSWQSVFFNLKTLKKFFSGRYLNEITPQLIEQFKAVRVQEVSHTSVNRNLQCLKVLFNKAIAWNKFSGKNPMNEVALFKESFGRLRFLEKDEIQTLLSNCDGYLKSVVVIALNTGLRKQNILKLKWRDIDFHRGIIHIYDTKNGEKIDLPLNEISKNALIQTRRNPKSEYVFASSSGIPFGDIKRAFHTALRRSGIKEFTFHDLRHTFASHLVMSGIDLNTVRELLGHKTLTMTLRYSHLSPDHKQRAVAVLSKRMDFEGLDSHYLDTREKEIVVSH